ncbi:unnamed protein product [Medioppia subpectinata]|uniref:Late endosomal/lysosomal adaptor and MAPK and MTOR activator 5 n=1 Tax=Medioppia subpectinata TaxID=1979941 RepID=A0A7R9PZ69_9ACAR|nr:unnamed protein product [Medioppia subpectinata]CAG2106616.1 unnamed protein product [Medioppia subpectinata]
MEKELKEICGEALNSDKVCGFLCVDNNGLCLTACGDASEKSSGTVATIASLAQKLDSSNPIVSIESDKRKILIKTTNEITTAIYKNC